MFICILKALSLETAWQKVPCHSVASSSARLPVTSVLSHTPLSRHTVSMELCICIQILHCMPKIKSTDHYSWALFYHKSHIADCVSKNTLVADSAYFLFFKKTAWIFDHVLGFSCTSPAVWFFLEPYLLQHKAYWSLWGGGGGCAALRLAVWDVEIVKLFVIARSQIKTL